MRSVKMRSTRHAFKLLIARILP